MPAHEQCSQTLYFLAGYQKKILTNVCVQATYEPPEFIYIYIYISNTVAGKVFFFRFCLLNIYTAGHFFSSWKQFCFTLS